MSKHWGGTFAARTGAWVWSFPAQEHHGIIIFMNRNTITWELPFLKGINLNYLVLSQLNVTGTAVIYITFHRYAKIANPSPPNRPLASQPPAKKIHESKQRKEMHKLDFGKYY